MIHLEDIKNSWIAAFLIESFIFLLVMGRGGVYLKFLFIAYLEFF